MEATILPGKDGTILIYQWGGSGYYPTPSGPRTSFLERPEEEMVTVLEIEAALNQLTFSIAVFNDYVNNLQVPPVQGPPKSSQPKQEKTP